MQQGLFVCLIFLGSKNEQAEPLYLKSAVLREFFSELEPEEFSVTKSLEKTHL